VTVMKLGKIEALWSSINVYIDTNWYKISRIISNIIWNRFTKIRTDTCLNINHIGNRRDKFIQWMQWIKMY
jgi:hypothetical protein